MFRDQERQRAYTREYQRQWRANRRAAFFKGKVCAKCDSDYRLELDHIDPAQKTKSTDHNIWSWSEDKRQAELAKCQILCYDCHRTKTTEFLRTAEHGSARMYQRYKCRCTECKEWKKKSDAEYRKKPKGYTPP